MLPATKADFNPTILLQDAWYFYHSVLPMLPVTCTFDLLNVTIPW